MCQIKLGNEKGCERRFQKIEPSVGFFQQTEILVASDLW